MIGVRVPSVGLQSTDGTIVDFSEIAGRTVSFFYPYTGKPGHPDPVGWDHIAGAHGSTSQALAFSALCDEFEKRDVKVFGVSFQTTELQQEFVLRNQLKFSLLSDVDRALTKALKLETFVAGGNDYLKRRTLVVENGKITLDFYPIPDPAQNAASVLEAL